MAATALTASEHSCEDARAAGLDVEVTAIELPAEVEDDALRIVQEGLTNAMKHAPGARVHVLVALAGDALEVELRDDGGGPPSALAGTGAGLGLSGMRERIESLGGSLDAGPRAEGGWRVHARLPGVATPVGVTRGSSRGMTTALRRAGSLRLPTQTRR